MHQIYVKIYFFTTFLFDFLSFLIFIFFSKVEFIERWLYNHIQATYVALQLHDIPDERY